MENVLKTQDSKDLFTSMKILIRERNLLSKRSYQKLWDQHAVDDATASLNAAIDVYGALLSNCIIDDVDAEVLDEIAKTSEEMAEEFSIDPEVLNKVSQATDEMERDIQKQL